MLKGKTGRRGHPHGLREMNWQIQTAARIGWGEVRGESDEGKRAFVHVVLNRQADGRWGKTLFEVCTYPFQFSALNKGDPNRDKLLALPDDDAILNQLETLFVTPGEDITKGATHYYAKGSKEPAWAKGQTPCAEIGNHLFYRGIK